MKQQWSVKQIPRGEAVFSSALFLIGCLLLAHSLIEQQRLSVSLWLSPYLFPLLASAVLTGLTALLLLRLAQPAKAPPAPAALPTRVLEMMALLAATALLLPYLGFLVATGAFLAAAMLRLGERRIWLVLAVSLGTAALLWLIFGQALHVLLPMGRWWS